MMRKYGIVCVLLAAFGLSLTAQVRYGGKPLPPVLTRSFQNRPFEEMPAFDLEAELRDDALNRSDLRGGYRFAYKFMTHFNRANSGDSFTLADGTRVWLLGIRSRGAVSINVLFTEYELPEGAQVFLYNASRTQVLGAFDHRNNSELGLLPVSPVQGDELIIEYHEPARAAFPGRLTVGEVNHGYRNLEGYEPGGDRSDYACMASPPCFGEGEYATISRSTVLLTIDGVTACTGVMVNNTQNDGKPYLLTASHCLNKDFSVKNPDYEAVAGRIICFFNYTSPTCDTLRRGTEEMSVASALYRAVNEKSDMALLELLQAPPPYYQPFYAGWTLEENGGTPPFAGIHHPRASMKRINIFRENLSLKTFNIGEVMEFYKDAHWNVGRWNEGSTDAGSSGSPLFDSAYRLTGYLSGGRSTCASPVDDYYAAVFKAWSPSDNVQEQLKAWLDPNESGLTILDGLDPYADNPSYRLSNIGEMKRQDSITVTKLPPPAGGNLFGVNSLGTTEYAEEYQVPENAQIDGVYFVTPAVADTERLDVEVTVYTGDEKPQTLLHTEVFLPTYLEQSVLDSSFIETEKWLNRAQESFIRFSQPLVVSGTFYIGYKIKAPENSSFTVYNLPPGQTTRNTAWINKQGEWVKASSHPQLPFNSSLFIDPVIHYTKDSSNDTLDRESGVKVWVDASRDRVHILFPQADSGTCRLYATGGQLLQEYLFGGSEAVVPVPGLHPGIYIIQVRGNKFSHTQKIFL
jgi:hypothetical protein